jgi:tonB-linked outer membrane protein, susC/ragA family
MKAKGIQLILLLMILVSLPTAGYAQVRGGQKASTVNSGTSVTGVVYDVDGETLPGVSIRIPKRNIGVVSNVDGEFTIQAKEGEVLVVSYVGKKALEVKATLGKPMKIVLEDEGGALREVVVTGIVDRDKTSFTGSTSSFTAEDLKVVGVQNPIASLAALDPAFNVLTNELAGSDPNHLPDINIRGKSSVIGTRDDAVNDPNQPLFIVDGFESTLEAVYNMDINRIASMTILKDAASTAIYGSKAANGVVVVETVKPKVGQLRLNYNGSVAMSNPDLTSYNLMNSAEKLEFERLAGRYNKTGQDSYETMIDKAEAYTKKLADIKSGVDTYWLSEPLRTGWNHRHNVYVDGGSEGFLFGIGLNYNGNNGVMKDSKRETYGGNIDLIYRVGKLQFQDKFSASYTNQANPIVDFSQYAAANPYYKKYDEDGKINPWLEYTDIAHASNPLYNASLNSRNKGNNLVISNSFAADYMPVKQLKFRAKFGITHTTSDTEVFLSPSDTRFNSLDATRKGTFNSSNSKSTRYNVALTAIYAEVFGLNRINVAGNFNVSQNKSLSQGWSVRGFPEGNYTYPSFSNGYPEGGMPSYYESTSRSTDFMATVNYSFDNRYLFDANYALNGSSVFGSNKKFINTWSVGLGWNIANEKFFSDLFPSVNMFKLRASIGNPGNQDFSSAMSLVTYRFLYNSFNYFGNSTVLGQIGNPELQWQTTIDRNVGVDFTTDRWNVEFDYYDKKTDPLLISVAAPPSTGLTSSWHTNLGEQRSKGILGTVSYYIIRNLRDRITWNVRATIRHEDIKLDGLNGGLDDLNKVAKTNSTKRYYDGADPDAIWAVRSAGIDPASGREMFIKKDGSYTFDYNVDDEVIIGNARSKIEGNIGTSVQWKGLSISANFTYRLGGKQFNSALFNKVENISGSQLNSNQDRRALYDRWQKPGDHAQFKNIANSAYTPMSSRFVQRNNNLTFQSLNVTYDFYEIARKMHLESFRLSFYCNDLFYISTIKQERGTSYPFARSYTFALSFTI